MFNKILWFFGPCFQILVVFFHTSVANVLLLAIYLAKWSDVEPQCSLSHTKLFSLERELKGCQWQREQRKMTVFRFNLESNLKEIPLI